ncbi:MAG: hypothetical protein ACJA2Q_000521 [Pseudohongiellaceae bacterium]|jgi:hypothetical protein
MWELDTEQLLATIDSIWVYRVIGGIDVIDDINHKYAWQGETSFLSFFNEARRGSLSFNQKRWSC